MEVQQQFSCRNSREIFTDTQREWQPTPVSLPGEFHGQKSLAGYSPWGRKESDTTECLMHTHAKQTSRTQSFKILGPKMTCANHACCSKAKQKPKHVKLFTPRHILIQNQKDHIDFILRILLPSKASCPKLNHKFLQITDNCEKLD